MMQPDDHRIVAEAIRAAEARTDGEVSVVVAPESDSYADVALHWALLAALLPLALFATFPDLLIRAIDVFHDPWASGGPPLRWTLTALMLDVVVTFLIAWAVLRIGRVRMFLTPHDTKARRVRRRAILIFQVGTEQRTASRTGVLLYLSLVEHRAEIVADQTIQSRIGGEEWGEAMALLLEGLRAGKPGDGIAAAVARIGDVLATQFPFTGTDPNEMPDRLIQL